MRAYSNVLAFCIFAALPLFAQEAQTPYVEKEERQFNFYPGGKIKIALAAPGNVQIVGWQKGSVSIEAEKILYNASPETAKSAFGNAPLRVRWTQTSATIGTSAIPGAKAEINLKIYVPRDKTDLTVEINRGDFSIESVNGWIEATTQEGLIEAKSLEGYFSGITHHGNVSIEMTGKRWRGLEFDALTHSGSIDLKLPDDFSAAIQFETRDGKISVDYPPQVVDGEPMPPSIIIRKNAQTLKASLGAGGAPIKLATYSGNITLRK